MVSLHSVDEGGDALQEHVHDPGGPLLLKLVGPEKLEHVEHRGGVELASRVARDEGEGAVMAAHRCHHGQHVARCA